MRSCGGGSRLVVGDEDGGGRYGKEEGEMKKNWCEMHYKR
jgi:hypothetical protein